MVEINTGKKIFSGIFKGFKFGLLLQIAIGPVCFFIFQLAVINGFFVAMIGILAVAIVDGLFIFGAIKGIAALLESRKMQTVLKYFGSFILMIFGLSTILSQFDINFLPALNAQNVSGAHNAFIQAAIITVSNPLTIIFWAGVFSAKILEENLGQQEVYFFGFGAVLTTLSFLSFIALIGTFSMTFLSAIAIQALNIFVGCILIYFGIRILMKKYVATELSE